MTRSRFGSVLAMGASAAGWAGPALAGIQAHHVEVEARKGRLSWIEGVLRGCAPGASEGRNANIAPVGAAGGEA